MTAAKLYQQIKSRKLNPKIVAIERFLVRVAQGKLAAVLKGGMAVQLRTGAERTTKDADLHVSGDPDALLSRLQAIAAVDAGDYFKYQVAPDPRKSELSANQDIEYGGKRYAVKAELGGHSFKFRIEAVFGELPTPERADADSLVFAGIEAVSIPVQPLINQLADQAWLHVVRPTEETDPRYRGLGDIYVLAKLPGIERSKLRNTIEAEFENREHTELSDMPDHFPDPAEAWGANETWVHRLLVATKLDDYETLVSKVREFLDPVFDGSAPEVSTWNPETWSWEAEPTSDNGDNDDDSGDGNGNEDEAQA